MASFTLTRTINADREKVFDVLTDHAGYKNILPLRGSVLEREGTPEPNGVGAIRKLSAVGPAIREEITLYERPSRFGYKALSGVPARDHSGLVELEEAGPGRTRMTYRVDTKPLIPVVMLPFLKVGIGQLAARVGKAAETR